MIKKVLFKKISARAAISCILTVISYILSIVYLFGFHDIFGSITCILITFILFHFRFIDIKRLKRQYFCIILIALILFEIWWFFLLDWEINTWIILSLIAYNWAIWALFFSLWMTSFDSISYFTRWWYIFTLFISITYSIAFVWMFQKFPFTCQWLNDASDKLFEFVEKPFVMLKWKKEKKAEENLLSQNVSKLIQELKDTNVSQIEWSNQQNALVTKFNEFKTNTIDQILADKSEYSDWVCDLLLDEINTILENNWVKRSVILLSYFLLYWFIRIAIFVMSGIAFIIFKILYRCKAYKIMEVKKTVDEIF